MNKKQIIILVILIIFTIGILLFAHYQQNSEPDDDTNNVIPSNNTIDINSGEKEENNTFTFKVDFTTEIYTTTNKSGEIVTKNSRNSPVIRCSKQNIANSIENKLNKIVNAQWEEIKNTADDVTANAPDELLNEYALSPIGANVLINNYNVLDKIVTFDILVDGNFGGVNWYEPTSYNFDLETGNLISLNTLVKDENAFKDAILNKFKEQLLQDEAEEDDSLANRLRDDWEEIFKEDIMKDGNWCVTSSGMSFIIPKYEITDGAAGPIGFMVEKEVINPLLQDLFQI